MAKSLNRGGGCMKPLYLELAHFGPYKEVVCLDFEHELNDGLFVVTGATGAGKSTLFEAIYFALYGEGTKKERGIKGYRSDFAKEDGRPSYVKLRFQVKNEVYEVVRIPLQTLPKKKGEGFREQKHEVILTKCHDEKVAPLTRIDEVRVKIESLLGLNQEQFKKIIMLPQGAFQNFLLAETQEKKLILRSLFGTERYVLLQERMKEKTSEMKKLYEALEKEITWLFQNSFGQEVKEIKVAQELLLEEKQQEEKMRSELKKQQEAIEEKSILLQKVLQRATEEKNLEECKISLKAHLSKEQDVRYFKEKLKKIDEVLLLVPKEDDLVSLSFEIEKASSNLNRLDEAIVLHEKEKNIWHLKEETYKVHLSEVETYTQALARLEKDLERAKTYQNYYALWKDKKTLLEKSDVTYKNFLEKQAREELILENLDEKLDFLNQLRLALFQVEENLVELQKKEEVYQAYLETLKAIEALDEKKNEYLKIWALKESAYANLKTQYEALKDKVFELYRSELAKLLKDGSPCPVCGALTHEKPFVGNSEVSLSDYELIEKQLKEAKEKLNSVEQQIKQIDYEKNHFLKQFTNLERVLALSTSEVKIAYIEVKKEIEALLKEKSASLEKLNEEMSLKQKRDKLLLQKKEAELYKVQLEESFSKQKEDVASYFALLKAHEGESYESLMEKNNKLQYKKEISQKAILNYETLGRSLSLNETRLITEKEAVFTHLEEMKKTYQSKKTVFDGLIKEKFSSYAYYEEVKKEIEHKDKINTRISLWENEKTKLESTISALEERIFLLPIGDEALLNEELERLKKQYQEESHALGALSQGIKTKTTTLHELREKCEKLDVITSEYGKYHTLVKLAIGENKWRMDFETFALIYYYDKVLYFANLRLKKMTEGRYYFIRQIETSDKRKQSGLGLDIMDEYTGRKRQVATLSGGESFKAALALALGLSDVVREESGGMALDTIFIDEGFGTLDDDALDSTLDTLMELEEGGRLVGIISHVAELKERIGAKLVVESTKEGSHAYFEASL